MKINPVRRDATERMARLLHILTLLRGKSDESAISVAQLECPLRYSRSTLYRELRFLQQEGFVCWESRGKVRLTPDGLVVPTAPLTPEDILAFGIARLALRHADGIAQQAIETPFAKIIDALSPGLQRLMQNALKAADFPEASSPSSVSNAPESALLACLQTVVAAIHNRHTLEMEYDSAGSGSGIRRLDPYRLEMQDSERMLLHGWCHRRQELRAFRVKRIVWVTSTRQNFGWRAELWDAYQKQDGIFQGLRGGSPVAVQVRFSPDVVRYVREHRWPAGVRFEMNDDGTATLAGTVQGKDGILVELLRWRRHAIVVGGPELKAAYLAELDAMRALYEK